MCESVIGVHICSGQTWDEKKSINFTANKKYISDYYLKGEDFDLNDVEYRDGVNEEGYFVHPSSNHQCNGSGSAIIPQNEGDDVVFWIGVEFDPNEKKTHRNGKPHVNLYGYCNNKKRLLPKYIHATDCKYAIVRLTNKDGDVFSDHQIRLD